MSSIGTGPGSFEERARSVGEALLRSLRVLLEGTGCSRLRNKELASRLRISAVQASRLRKLAAARDGLQAILLSPGKGPLLQFVEGFRAAGAPEDDCDRLQRAAERLDAFIQLEAEDRRTLETLLAEHLPGGREAFELPRRQATFRALQEAAGISARVIVDTTIVTPAGEGGLSYSSLFGAYALERQRADVSWAATVQPAQAGDGGFASFQPIATGSAGNGALDRFCTNTPAPLEFTSGEGEVHEVRLGPTGFGPSSRVDLLSFEPRVATLPMAAPAIGAPRSVGFVTGIPATEVVIEVLVHRDLWEGGAPRLLRASTIGTGPADVRDAGVVRRARRLDHAVQRVDGGPRSWGLDQAKKRDDLLTFAIEELGASVEDFTMWRVSLPFASPWHHHLLVWPHADDELYS